MFNIFNPMPASTYGMPERASRQWVIEHSDLAGQTIMKTPDFADVPIPQDRRDGKFTHAAYSVDCDHEDVCACSDDDSVEWMFVEFLNLTYRALKP